MASKQKPVAWLHLVGEPHEEQRIAGQSWGEGENTIVYYSFLLYMWVYQYMRLHVLPKVILPLIISGLFFISAMAAIGRPQFATGPQKCCTDTHKGTQYSLDHRLYIIWTFILRWLYSRTELHNNYHVHIYHNIQWIISMTILCSTNNQR